MVRGVAIWAAFASASAILAMVVASALLELFDWRAIFVASARSRSAAPALILM